MNKLSEKFIRFLARFIVGIAVLFGLMLVMVMAWVIFWDKPNIGTTTCTMVLAYVIGYAIEKALIHYEENNTKK